MLPYLALALLALAAPFPPAAAAQQDSVTVAAGARYEADEAQRFLLGVKYRDLWTLPIRVAVLNPDTFAGGLEVLELGGGSQTRSLRLGAADGREFVFRSVDKDQEGGLPEDLRNTLVSRIAQDQVSAKHPGAALVVAPLLDAVGVLHATPQLRVMPDHPFLGEFRDEFAGMLGTIEVRPEDAGEGEPEFAGFNQVIGTPRLLERLEETPEDRVDARAFLTARLMDLVVGDWDRHPDQWRWGRDERDGVRFWVPIPRDRDNAFSNYDGFLPSLASGSIPYILHFDEEFPKLSALTYNAEPLDRELLAELPMEVWDSVAAAIQARLTDAAIDGAMQRLPSAYRARSGEELARKLKARRDLLPGYAREFYLQLAGEPQILATDEVDFADVRRLPDGSVRVRLHRDSAGGALFFDRLFLPRETREVRLFLRGDDDRAVVRGDGPGEILVRVIGGGSDDVLADSSRVSSGRRAAFYDDSGDNELIGGPGTVIERREYVVAASGGTLVNNAPDPRDWGATRSWFSPWADWKSGIGPVIGGGPGWTRYGFRRAPYASRLQVRGEYAPFHGRVGVEAKGHVVRTGGRSSLQMSARASGVSLTRFHGFGNETDADGDDDRYRVWETEYMLGARLNRHVSERVSLFAGPLVRYIRPDPAAGSPAALPGALGSDPYGALGGEGGFEIDTRDSEVFPRRGIRLHSAVEAYPVAWEGADAAFGTGRVTAAGYAPLPLPLETTLALRVGGEQAWGEFPIQHAAFVGGGSSLRGYHTERFAGDASLFANAELRTRLGRVNLGLARGELGVFALSDAGRVYQDGESSDRWHTSAGGGLWFLTLDRAIGVHMLYAYGDRHHLSLGIGLPF